MDFKVTLDKESRDRVDRLIELWQETNQLIRRFLDRNRDPR